MILLLTILQPLVGKAVHHLLLTNYRGVGVMNIIVKVYDMVLCDQLMQREQASSF